MSVGQPWSVQVELVEGCTRLCPFCGLNGIRQSPGNFKYMSDFTADLAAEDLADLCPEARYEFAMHGEPLAHPHYMGMLKIFREYLPKAQFQVTTNGARLKANKGRLFLKRVSELFEVVDFIILDTYYPERDTLRELAFEVDGKEGITVTDFYDDCVPEGFSPWHNHHRKVKRTIILMDDLGARDGEVKSRVIMNHAGNTTVKPALAEPLRKMCTIPFRELSLCWNGNVNICCMDWGHEYTAGNVEETSLKDIWHGEAFEAARRVLFQRIRGFTPCMRCDAPSGSRVGLVPKYSEPDGHDVATILDVTARSLKQNGFGRDMLMEVIEKWGYTDEEE